MTNEIHLNDIGTKFLLTILDGSAAIDISSASTKTIIFRKSNKIIVEQTATFETDGTDGQIYYITLTGDLNITGIWSIQAKIILPTGTWRSDVQTFEVHANL